MEPMVKELMRLVDIVTGSPATTDVKLLVASVATLMVIFLITKVGNLFDFALSSYSRSLVLVVLNGVVLFAAAAAAVVYAGPKIPDATLVLWLPLITAVLLLLIVTAPLMMLIQKAKYIHAVICIVLSLAGGAVAVSLTHAAVDAFSGGSDEVRKSRKSHDVLNEVMAP